MKQQIILKLKNTSACLSHRLEAEQSLFAKHICWPTSIFLKYIVLYFLIKKGEETGNREDGQKKHGSEGNERKKERKFKKEENGMLRYR